MSHLFGVGLNIEVNRIICDFRMQLQKKQGLALRSLSLALYKCGSEISCTQFEKVLASFAIFTTKVQMQALMKAFNSNGCLCVTSFLAALRPSLEGRRAAIVRAAWDHISEGKDCVSLARMCECYDVSRNADFVEGTQTKEQIFQSFAEGLSYNGQSVSEVHCDSEWRFYQEDLALSIVDDEYFVRMTECVWGVCEDSASTVKKTELEHITRTVRHRLLDLSSATVSAEHVMRNVFREFDRTRSGHLTSAELQQMLIRLQVVVEQRYLDALLRRFDRRGDGVVEFEELVGYLMENPYK